MGWWSIPEKSSVHVGDEAFSLTYRYLDELRELYVEALGRKPTVEELGALWGIALAVHGGPAELSDMEEREVTSVVVRTKKRPPRQVVQVGDVFAIPLGPREFGFGRIVNLGRDWKLAEIYAHVASSPRYSVELASAQRLFPPVLVDMNGAFFEGRGRWRVIHRDPSFVLPDLETLEYRAYGDEILRVNTFDSRKSPSLHYVMGLPKYSLMHVETTEALIKKALCEQGLVGAVKEEQ
jgi:hypothetical protein